MPCTLGFCSIEYITPCIFEMQNLNIDLSKLYAENNLLPTHTEIILCFCGYLDAHISRSGWIDVGNN
jgi:hypothetical protein